MKKDKNLALFAISFKQGFISPNVPIITVMQGKKKLHFLLDTGCDNNVVDVNILDSLKYEKTEGKVNLTGFGGKSEVSKCNISFECDNKSYTEEFLVADLTDAFTTMEDWHSIKLCGMLGSCFLRKNNLVLDFETLTLYSRDKIASNAEDNNEPK